MLQIRRHDAKAAFTIVELLVVIFIIGLLVGLLLPAIQSAREAARRATCNNRIRQLSLALLLHHESKSNFPFGGWGRDWSGMPGRGSAHSQPGGWIYSILPQLEENSLYELGNSGSESEREAAYTQRLQTPIPQTYCPSRRSISLGPVSKSYATEPMPYGKVTQTARSDYAINSGSSNVITFPGPMTLEDGDRDEWWLSHGTSTLLPGRFSGIVHFRQAAPLRSVTDGSSNTYLVGEKHISVKNYDTGLSPGDNSSPYNGYSFNTHRFTSETTFDGEILYFPPLADIDSDLTTHLPHVRFGGPHPSVFQMAFCDGSVRAISFDIALDVHRWHSGREDGELTAFALE